MEHYNFSQSGLMSFSATAEVGVNPHYEKTLSFEERAINELMTQDIDTEKKFFPIYNEDGFICYADSIDETLSVSLTPPSHSFSSSTLKRRPAICCGVFVRDGKKFKPLYQNKRFYEDKAPIFLSLTNIKKLYKEFFEIIEIKLGQLTKNDDKFIAWELTTSEGHFYIPWHNGLIFAKEEGVSFEEKKLDDLKQTYFILRFTEVFPKGEHRVLRA